MKSASAATPAPAAASTTVALGSTRSTLLTVSADGDRAVVRIEAIEREPIEITVDMSERGPVLRIRAASLDMQADEIALACREFSVNARERIALRTGGDLVSEVSGKVETTAHQMALEARLGSVVVRANDDVQLLGEQILLNCERTSPVPDWVPGARADVPGTRPIPVSSVTGDASLLHDVLVNANVKDRSG